MLRYIRRRQAFPGPSSASRIGAFYRFSPLPVGKAAAPRGSAEPKAFLFGCCLLLSLLTGCLETLDEAIDRNVSPKANAGDDQTVELVSEKATVILDGSKSTDRDGRIVKYVWRGGTPKPISMDAGAGDGAASNGIRVDAEAADADSLEDGEVDENPEGEEALDGGIEEVMETPDPDDTEKPQVRLGEGVHTFNLWVIDDDGAVSIDTVVVTVKRPEGS